MNGAYTVKRNESAVLVAGAVALALSLSVVGTGVSAQSSSANTSKFTHARKTVVPATRFERRFDDLSISDDPSPGTSSSSGTMPPGVPNSGSGLVPPPPPARPAGKYGLIPPPPPIITSGAMPSSALSAGPAMKGNWGSSTSSTGTRARTVDPKSSLAATRATARVQQLTSEGRFGQAQELLKTYLRAYPRDKTLKREYVKVAVQHAQKQLSSNDVTGAASSLRDGLSVDPNYLPARDLLGRTLSQSGVNPLSPVDRLKIANQLLAEGRTTDAGIEYQAALQLKPSAEGYVGLGDVAMHEGRRDDAKAQYQRALEVSPNSSLALRQMGVLLLQRNDVVGANSDLSRALVISPADKIASKNLIDLWQRQVAINPKCATGHFGLARAYQLSGNLPAAQGEYREVVRIDPNNPNLPAARQSFKLALARQEAQKSIDTARQLEAQGQLPDAHQKVLEAVGLCPGDTAMRLYQGQLSQRMGFYSEAHDAYLSVLRSDPNNIEATKGLQELPSIAAAPDTVSASGAPPLAPAMVGMAATAGSLSALQSAGTPVVAPAATAAAAAPGIAAPSTIMPAVVPGAVAASAASASAVSTAGSPPAYKVMTTPHIATMGSFLGQLRDLGMSAQQASRSLESAYSGGASPLGTTAGAVGLGGASGLSGLAAGSPGGLAAGSPGGLAAGGASASLPGVPSAAAVQELAADVPIVNSNAVASALSQAQAALQSAGVAPTQPAAAPVAQAAAVPASTAPAAAAPPPSMLGAAMADLPQFGGSSSNANMMQMAQQFLGNDQMMNSSDMNTLYQRYRGKLSQRLGMQLPQNLPGQGGTPAPAAAQPAATAATAAPVAQAAAPQAAAAVPVVAPQATPAVSAVPILAPPIVAPPVVTPDPNANPELQIAYQRMGSLEEQNKALREQLAQALGQNNGAQVAAVVPSAVPALSAAPSLSPAGHAPLVSPLKGAIPPPQPVKLELEGVVPTPMDVHLKVVLKNDQSVPLSVPNGIKAIVRMNGKDRLAKVTFPGKSVPAGGEMHGLIKVSGHNLNPAADLWLPDMLPAQTGSKDLHLTVPISAAL